MKLLATPTNKTNQLNQQNQSTKPATTQDYNFLKDASSIYVTSLAGNHVAGTTTLTTSSVSSCNLNAAQSQGASQSDANQSHISQSIVHVHQPPPSVYIAPAVKPLAGGWLIGDSAKGIPITANEQQVYQNILNNNNNNCNSNSNNISVSSAGGTIVYSSNSVTSASESVSKFVLDPSVLVSNNSNLNKLHGSSVDAQTETSTELLANGYGPRKEVSVRDFGSNFPQFHQYLIAVMCTVKWTKCVFLSPFFFLCCLWTQLSESTVLQESSIDTNRISSIGNTSIPVQTGRNEILLGDQSLRQDNR